MDPTYRPLRLYGEPSTLAPLEWSWVDAQLLASGTYWVTAPGGTHPHPRPVWGCWHLDRIILSVGSPVIRRLAGVGTPVTVHLDSGTDVVIVEGVIAGATDAPDVLDAYNRKYDWAYSVADYGPLMTIRPQTVLAWRAAGWAGRESFVATGRWTYQEPGTDQEPAGV